MRLLKPLLNNRAGFTLLEVLIAVSIMLVAFGAILSIESSAITISARARDMGTVAMLAKGAMIQTEYDIEGKTFDEVKPEETHAFDPPYETYSWTRTVKEVKFPNLMPSSSNEGGGDEGTNTLMKLITQFLSKALREVTVTVNWKQKGGQQSFSVSTYWVNLNQEFQLSE